MSKLQAGRPYPLSLNETSAALVGLHLPRKRVSSPIRLCQRDGICGRNLGKGEEWYEEKMSD